jgi:hypothetical protein
VNSREQHTWMTAAWGLAAVMLAGPPLGKIPWWLGVPVGLASLGAGFWLWRQQRPQAAEAGTVIGGGLRVVEKPLPAAKSRPPGLRVTISTEMPVAHGLRLVCDTRILDFEALAQSGRGPTARQGVPVSVREGQRGLLFVARNTAGQRELVLRIDLFAAQPIHLERVEQIRAGDGAALPEWRELAPMNPAAAGSTAAAGDAIAPAVDAMDGAAAADAPAADAGSHTAAPAQEPMA